MSEIETRESVRAGVVGLLSKVSSVAGDRIRDGDNLSSLGLDSLDIAELDIMFDERYGFDLEEFYDFAVGARVPDLDVYGPVEARTTVGQIVDYTFKRLDEKSVAS